MLALLAMPAMADDIDQLIKDLQDPNSDVRIEAAGSLGSTKEARAVNPLIGALKDENEEVRMSAWNSLTDIIKVGDPQAIDPLIRALKDEDEFVRYCVADILGETSDARAVDSLIAALKDEDSEVRLTAVLSLGKIGDPKAVDSLKQALKDEESNVRIAAAEVLGKMGYSGTETNRANIGATGAGSSDSVSAPDQKSLVRTIGPEGGSINLGGGIRIIFPAGAVDENVEVSASKIDSSAYLKDDLYDGVVIAVNNLKGKLNKPAEIRVPLPSYLGLDDGSLVSGGTIDDSTGTLIVENCSIETIGEGVEAVLSADHFTNKYVRWLKETFLQEPSEYGPLNVPYYEQGGPWCWAASTLMVCQAAKLKEDAQVFHVIGKVRAIDETGIEADNVSLLNSYVQEHTDMAPETQVLALKTQAADYLRTYVRKQLAFKHTPVVVISSNKNHAWVIVGYNGNEFYVNDPQDPGKTPPYSLMSWGSEGEGLGKLWMNDCLSTLVVPVDISSNSYPVSLNLLSQGLSFNEINPKNKHRFPHNFNWDSHADSGYSISDADKNIVLPGSVTYLEIGKNLLSIANPDRKSARQVTISIDVVEEGRYSSKSGVSHSKTIVVPPASVVYPVFDPIQVSDFYTDGVDRYQFRARAYEGEKLVAEAVVLFELKPTKLKIEGCIVKDAATLDPYEFIVGSSEGADNVQVELVFTYVPPGYASKTPLSMTTTTDDEGYYEFEVPPGSTYNIIVNDKEYNGKTYTSLEGASYTCIDIRSP